MTNPFGLAPRTYDPAVLKAWTDEIEKARVEYRDHPISNACPPRHDCHYLRSKRYHR